MPTALTNSKLTLEFTNSSYQKLYYDQLNAITPNTKFTTTTADKVKLTMSIIAKRAVDRRLLKLNLPINMKQSTVLKCDEGHLLWKVPDTDVNLYEDETCY